MLRLAIAGLGLALACAAPAAAQTLQPARLPGMCVTIDAAEGSVSRPCDQSEAQNFLLPREAPGPIRHGQACLAPRGEGLYPSLHPEACDGSPAQTWTISAEGEVRNGAGRCLALLGQSSRTGERVYGGHCPREGAAHQWAAKANGQEIYDNVRGRLRWGGAQDLCLAWTRSSIGLAPCGENFEQLFAFDRRGPSQFRSMSGCLTSFPAAGGLNIAECHVGPDKIWMLQESGLLSNGDGVCVEPEQNGERWSAGLARCAMKPEQSWTFEAVG